MNASRTILATLALAFLVASAGGGWAVWTFARQPERVEYAAAPFKPVGADFPRILPVKEAPRGNDAAARDRQRAESAKIRKFQREEGAVARISPAERDAYLAVLDAIEKERDGYVKTRDLVGKVLDSDPASVVGHFVMAKVEHYGEANLPRALFEIRRARRHLEAFGKEHPDDADAREWYIRILYEEFLILDSMDRRQEQLQVADLLDQVYQPMPWLRLFTLIKLDRLDEVERPAGRGTGAARDLAAPNAEYAAHGRRTASRSSPPSTRPARKMITKITDKHFVLWQNYGEACVNDFRLDEALAAYEKSTKTSNDYHGSPYFPLSHLQVQSGLFRNAWQSIRSGQADRGKRMPHTLQQDQSTVDSSAAIAQVLLAVGKGPEAERFARRAYERPGRVSSKTDSERDDSFNSGFLLWLVLEMRLAPWGADATRSVADWQRESLRAEAWALRQKLTKIVGDPEFLVSLFRPNLPGQASVETWQLGALLALVPAGVAEEALAQARKAETHVGAVPYFDAIEAELALRRGRHEQALTLANAALAKLPIEAEKLLRARVAAVGAEAALRLGRPEVAQPLTVQALRDFPNVFRLLGLRLPIRIEDDGSPLARSVATQLLASARFRADPNGFLVQVRVVDDRITMNLQRTETERHVQVEVPVGKNADPATTATTRFHERVLSPQLDLSVVDVNAVEQMTRPHG